MDSWLYVAGPDFVTVHGLRHGDDDDDDSEEEVKRIGRRTRKREERRTKMRRTRKRRMMIRIKGKMERTRSVVTSVSVPQERRRRPPAAL